MLEIKLTCFDTEELSLITPAIEKIMQRRDKLNDALAVAPTISGLAGVSPANIEGGVPVGVGVDVVADDTRLETPSPRRPSRKPKNPPAAQAASQPAVEQNTGSQSPAFSSLSPGDPAVEPAPAVAEGDATPETAGAADVTADDVREAMTNLVAAKSLIVATELLQKFKAKRVSDLKAEDYTKVIAECSKLANT